MAAVRGTACAALLTLTFAAEARAEPPARTVFSVRAGDRVRVWASDLSGQALSGSVGTVNAADHAGLLVLVEEQPRIVPFGSIQRLDVSRGRQYVLAATAVGALLGVAAGALLTDEDVIDTRLSDLERSLIAAATGVAGAFAGRAVGRSIPDERWQSVDLTPVRSSPRPSGVGASFSFCF